jgi:nucleotide-binding universal stress UspA family protein
MAGSDTRKSAGPVVVGVDGSPAAQAAAETAAQVASRRDLPLRLVRALPTPEPVGRTVPAPRVDRDSEREAARTQLEATARSLGLPGDAVTAVVREGPAELVRLHESRSATVLVVGAGSGRVAEALVRRSACPVLVDRPAAAHGTIVVGVTGSTGTAALLAWTAAEAARRGSALLVLHGWSRPAVEPAAVDAAERALCRGYLEPLKAEFPELRVDVRVEHGDPEQYLVRAAAEAELLVVGRRPQADRMSRAGRVAAAAATPVLVVPLESAPSTARPDIMGTTSRTGTR